MALDLRPLTLGELLDRGFTMYRRHLWLFVGIAAVPAVLALALALLVQVMQMKTLNTALAAQNQTGPPNIDPEAIMTIMSLVGGIMLLALAYWVVYMVALGATTFAVSEIYVGRAVTIREVYGKMSDRLGALVLLLILIALRVTGIFMAAGVLGAVVVGVAAILSPIAAAIAVIVTMLGLGLVFAGCFYMVLRYAVAVPALVIERLTARLSIKRSIELTKGRLLRVFLLVICATMVTYATVAIFQGPFIIGSMLAEPGTQRWLWLSVAGSVVGTIGAAFTTPFLIIGLALIYYDARIRDEGLDLELTLAALDTPARA